MTHKTRESIDEQQKQMQAKTMTTPTMKYFTIMRAEQKPYCYGGGNDDEHIPMWEGWAEGDMDSDHSAADLILSPQNFPAGTRITVEEPCCPKCQLNASLCMETDCDFDWKAWAEDNYA